MTPTTSTPSAARSPCSCGEATAHVIARRMTSDGTRVLLWSDGALSGAHGLKLSGVPMCRPRTTDAAGLALRAGWLLLWEIELWDATELPALYEAAMRTARLHGLPGDLRARMAVPSLPPLSWLVTCTDRSGKTTERQARLPRLRWPGLAIIDYCGGPGSAAGRYHLVGTNRMIDDTAIATGFRFSSLRHLFEHLRREYPASPRR